jgi:hypothetical protein
MRGDAPHELGMSVDRIVSEIFPDETGGARLQQVGLFIVIFVLEGDRAPVTAPRLAELTGESVSQVQKQLQKLVKVGVAAIALASCPQLAQPGTVGPSAQCLLSRAKLTFTENETSANFAAAWRPPSVTVLGRVATALRLTPAN